MALQDTDLLAVWRDTDQKNYSTTVSQIIARVPLPEAPPLTAVLNTNNTAQNVGIIIEDTFNNEVINLNPDGSATFALNVEIDNELVIGATPKIYLKNTGEIKGYEMQLLGNTTTANALAVYAAGSDIADLKVEDQVAVIDNTGKATFTGALEAESIDGGVYAAD